MIESRQTYEVQVRTDSVSETFWVAARTQADVLNAVGMGVEVTITPRPDIRPVYTDMDIVLPEESEMLARKIMRKKIA